MLGKKKFRGRTLEKNEWVYGDLFRLKDNHCSIHYYDENNSQFLIEVDPLTVGQFTDIPDRNGVDIYEGHVVCVDADGLLGKVVFHHGSFKTRLATTNILIDLGWWRRENLEVQGDTIVNDCKEELE